MQSNENSQLGVAPNGTIQGAGSGHVAAMAAGGVHVARRSLTAIRDIRYNPYPCQDISTLFPIVTVWLRTPDKAVIILSILEFMYEVLLLTC